ncbi:MAG: hypothetical protein NTW54_06530 [Bacteroidetes bacterium]|nr:hypothetical protein [Bacteroidota bacterium]
MKKLVFSLFVNLFATLIFAQTESSSLMPQRNSAYIEIFGQGLNSSFTFDRLYRLNKKVKSSFSIGLVIVPKFEHFGEGGYLGVPISYNFLFGKKNHHLELGMGLTVLGLSSGFAGEGLTKVISYYSYFTPKIGYRFQKPQGGLFFRIGLAPMIAFINYATFGGLSDYRNFEYFNNVVDLGYRVFPWPGMSFGYTFKRQKH